jgi:signal transduction histidine kinase
MTANGAHGSLRTRLLGVVLIGAVLPLAAIGFWLSTNAIRSGEALLRSQLEQSLARQADRVAADWPHRVSDAMLLAGNEPLRLALATGATAPPAFVAAAFATMPSLQSATVRDATGRERFFLGDRPLDGVRRVGPDGAVAPSPTVGLRVPVPGEDGRKAGEVEIRVRASALFPVPTSGGPDAPMLAVRDRSTGAWLVTPSARAALFGDDRFQWNDQEWLVARRSLEAPSLDLMLASPLDPIIAPFARNARAGAIALVAAALVVMLVTVMATLRLTRSLGQLAVAADAVAQGDLERRVGVRGSDEVARVARAFNAMTENLRRILREKSQGEALAAMGELAAVLAHQVRSPLTAMRLDLQRVESRLQSADRELVGRAIEQLDRLERSVGGALRMAKSAAGTFEAVDLLAPLGRAVKGIEHDVKSRGVELAVTQPLQGGIAVRGDAGTLEQLFSNVLHNAAEATSAGGRVSVGAFRDNGRATVVVEDTGAGMSAATLARVFEPFYSTKPEGTGIGLAVAQRIVQAHGGSLEITSEQGRGTRVAMSFATINEH